MNILEDILNARLFFLEFFIFDVGDCICAIESRGCFGILKENSGLDTRMCLDASFTYSLHHLTDDQKIASLHTLQDCLKENRKILIGDVAFETREKLNQCREAAGDEWDDEEIYFVVDELKSVFPNLFFAQISCCAGILTLAR